MLMPPVEHMIMYRRMGSSSIPPPPSVVGPSEEELMEDEAVVGHGSRFVGETLSLNLPMKVKGGKRKGFKVGGGGQ